MRGRPATFLFEHLDYDPHEKFHSFMSFEPIIPPIAEWGEAKRVLFGPSERGMPCAVWWWCLDVFGRLGIPAYGGGGGEKHATDRQPKRRNLRCGSPNAYIEARNIPANNVLYITPPQTGGFPRMWITGKQFTTYYQTPILSAIAARGLGNQIDYIGTIGQAQLICGRRLHRLQSGGPVLETTAWRK